MSGDPRSAARAFVRSLNILLKFARLYEFGHVRTAAQFETTWSELRSALDESGETGLLLGASGSQILLDGVPLGAAAAEKSFAQLLTSSGIASIHFSPQATQGSFARFVRAFPSGGSKASSLAEQLKAALAGDNSIKINEIRFVAEDSSVAGIKVAAQLTAKMLGGAGDKYRDFFEDPQKMLQLILAAESSRGGGGGAGAGSGGAGGGGAGSGASWSGGAGSGSLWDAGKTSGAGGGGVAPADGGGFGGGGGSAGGDTGVAEPGKWSTVSAMLRGSMGGAGVATGGMEGGEYAVAEENVRSMIGLFAQLGKARKDPETRVDVGSFQSRLTSLPVRAQFTLQQALAGLAAQAPMDKPDKPMLLKLAEHVAIRFALDSYERGELRVNAVKQMLDRMNAEIEALRKILGQQEQTMASAGIQMQSYTELLDQEFWSQVPDENKKEVLTSDEAWCVPPHNVRGFLEEMLRRGELKTVNEILTKYAACVALEATEARRTTAIGLADLAEFYGSGDGSALIDVIQRLGNQLAVEQESDLQTLVGAAFVRMSQEAGSKRFYPALQQSLASLDSVETLRPGSTSSLRQRIGAEERLPEFVEDTMRTGQLADGMLDIMALMPKATLHYLTNRFANCGFREDCELLAQIVGGLGEEAIHRLEETLQNAPATEATEVIGLLSHLSPQSVERLLPQRLAQWPRTSHDRTLRQLSSTPSPRRAQLLVALYHSLDPMIRPLALDEMGMAGQTDCIATLVDLLQEDSTPGFTRVKAIEAAGRLRASAASSWLQQILEAKQMWRWVYPSELRVAAAQALQKIEPVLAMDKIGASGLDRKELVLEPLDAELNVPVIRQRRYARLKLAKHVSAVTTNLRENLRLSIAELNMGGGLGAADRHLAPGSLLSLKISYGVRTMRAQAIVRGARPQTMAFEFVDMELDDRAKLRKLLLDLGGLPQTSNVGNRSRRQSRVAVAPK